jgi:hypothetical protein
LAKVLIAANRRSAAKYLNQIVKVMGASVSISEIYSRIKEKYPEVAKLWKFNDVNALKLTKELSAVTINDRFISPTEKQLLADAPWWWSKI